jgi:hypothetical protein
MLRLSLTTLCSSRSSPVLFTCEYSRAPEGLIECLVPYDGWTQRFAPGLTEASMPSVGAVAHRVDPSILAVLKQVHHVRSVGIGLIPGLKLGAIPLPPASTSLEHVPSELRKGPASYRPESPASATKGDFEPIVSAIPPRALTAAIVNATYLCPTKSP